MYFAIRCRAQRSHSTSDPVRLDHQAKNRALVCSATFAFCSAVKIRLLKRRNGEKVERRNSEVGKYDFRFSVLESQTFKRGGREERGADLIDSKTMPWLAPRPSRSPRSKIRVACSWETQKREPQSKRCFLPVGARRSTGIKAMTGLGVHWLSPSCATRVVVAP